jgi:hypothetical protein
MLPDPISSAVHQIEDIAEMTEEVETLANSEEQNSEHRLSEWILLQNINITPKRKWAQVDTDISPLSKRLFKVRENLDDFLENRARYKKAKATLKEIYLEFQGDE